MKRDRVVWSSATERVVYVTVPRRPGRLRRAVRTGFLLTVVGLMWVFRNPRWRCLLLGVALTIPGLVMRGQLAGQIILFPGLMALGYAPFLPGDIYMNRKDHTRLCRELSAYSTPAERCDFAALLTQYSDQETGELRAILARQELLDIRYGLPGRGPR
jgi:hypothetical protein